MTNVGSAMPVMVMFKAALRPKLSPIQPKINDPSGLDNDPIANTVYVVIKATPVLVPGKKDAASISGQNPYKL